MDKIVIIRGGGDIGSAVAHRLYRAGFNVVITEIDNPAVIRRTISFAQAVFTGETVVEGVCCKLISNYKEIKEKQQSYIPIIVDKDLGILEHISSLALVDCTLAKKNTGIKKGMADLVIAIGPGFVAPHEVDAVIESQRGHDLGRVIYQGSAMENTGIPGDIQGFTLERVIRSHSRGVIRDCLEIGSVVNKGDIVCFIAGLPIQATINGLLRGIINEGTYVEENTKIADIDPRGEGRYCFTISDKGRTISGSVLEVLCNHLIHCVV